ncbi:hypothetical protein PTSG_12375 [Salpingoeca rosetta]|uniref:UNC93-like protein MFSD11 n=1 Tax=Salpingoeca rosetta (strain ATCC 50818 / BSB-021) TaxID=946362 RepID=F2UDC9_SALR5|nr:uncharacterized protein PTSG_12375 [Salpingoeca rosetta]EGD74624.1 hypothetical protein PTSG_12375 [Salpingoeca rosetta]|eukprot:XP_004992881.1 hypothetical protein PTSG_12375 [Salpingoeca rosetta]
MMEACDNSDRRRDRRREEDRAERGEGGGSDSGGGEGRYNAASDEQQPLLSSSSASSTSGSPRTPSQVYAVSLAFFVLFLAYNSLQNYTTSLLPNGLGNQSLAILYISVPFFCFTGPPIVQRLGEKWTMVLGSSTYILFMGSLIKVIPALVKAASVVIGFGAAILWIAVGPYITKASTTDTVGRNNGIFWGIFQFSNVIGNIGAYFIFDNLGGSTALFLALTAIGGLAVIIFCFIKPTSKFSTQYHHQNSEALLEEKRTVWEDVKATLVILQTNEMLLLLYMFLFTGLELAFWSGEFPQLLDASVIGLVLCFAGVGEIAGSLFTNRLSDRLGCSLMLGVGAVVYAAGLTLVSFIHLDPPGTRPLWKGASWMAYVSAFAFGVGDSCLNTQVYALLGKLTKGATAVKAFTVFQIFQNLGSALGFFLGTQLPMHGHNASLAQVYIQALILLIGTVFFIRVDVQHSRKTKRRQQQEQQEQAAREAKSTDSHHHGHHHHHHHHDHDHHHHVGVNRANGMHA